MNNKILNISSRVYILIFFCKIIKNIPFIIFVVLSLNCNQLLSQNKSSQGNDTILLEEINNRIDTLEYNYKNITQEIKIMDRRLSVNVESITKQLSIIALIMSCLGFIGFFTLGKRLYTSYDKKLKKSQKEYIRIEKIYIESARRVFDIIGAVIIESCKNNDKKSRDNITTLHHTLMNTISIDEPTVISGLQHLPVMALKLSILSDSITHHLNSIRQSWIIRQQEGIFQEVEMINRILRGIDDAVELIKNKKAY